MKSLQLLLLLGATLSLASCEQSQKPQPQLPPPPMTSSLSNSQTSFATDAPKKQEDFVPCSSLKHGQVSRQDTTGTLMWLLPVLRVIDASCPVTK